MLQSVTAECYRVSQGITECFTECHRVLESITEYYRVLESITEYYKSSASTWTNFWACLNDSALETIAPKKKKIIDVCFLFYFQTYRGH